MAMIALGWMGWTEEQALRTDANAIQIAYEGCCDKYRAIFGSTEPAAATAVSSQPMTAELFDAMF